MFKLSFSFFEVMDIYGGWLISMMCSPLAGEHE